MLSSVAFVQAKTTSKRMMKKIAILLFSALLLLSIKSNAQAQDATIAELQKQLDELKREVKRLDASYEEDNAFLDKLKKLKISGFIQSQYQVGESAGGFSTYAGGNFDEGTRDRFLVRRGRLRLDYSSSWSTYAFHIDVTQGGVVIKDVFLTVKEPWVKSFSLTAGSFKWPFGYQILYPAHQRPAPEWSRVFETILPAARDLGAMLTYSPESGCLSFLTVNAGLFNGTGNTTTENDRNKDFVGQIKFALPFKKQHFTVDGGVSLYAGKVTSNTRYIYDDVRNAQFSIDSSAGNIGKCFQRTYYGGDLQVYYEVPGLGQAALKGEFATGKQPSTGASAKFYKSTSSSDALYMRNFTGWCVDYIQNIGSKNQLVLRYDEFDPNTDADKNDIGAPGANFTAADIKYATVGLGWVYFWDECLKFTVYYDMVTNEKVNAAATGSLASYTKDIHDNVLTVRSQFKF
ncbi:phosphate-selective porin O and P [Chloroherpeton thalassium ATCC 35110]|uniref:Phosphate-selective porin O and P n=1 Tax=Chloroherpeton thalassium (strain ATCC 35110 / GB-78) TaxID=517418 RepID=B3QWZ9_CHLT3|nr:hypothetical protein [Chloroherpeton thalassium]ACF13363.1 phosphate-selective porin O and P [Chloroherpeton thalassium ATCC 35110]